MLTDSLSCTQQCTPANPLEAFDWQHLWHTVTRLITAPMSCRVSSYLLHALLANGCVQYQDIAEEVNAIVTVPESNAPAIICDSSLLLVTHLLHMRNTKVPGGNSIACHQIIRWFSAKWNPGKVNDFYRLCLLLMDNS